jgi:hypothetical protein
MRLIEINRIIVNSVSKDEVLSSSLLTVEKGEYKQKKENIRRM